MKQTRNCKQVRHPKNLFLKIYLPQMQMKNLLLCPRADENGIPAGLIRPIFMKFFGESQMDPSKIHSHLLMVRRKDPWPGETAPARRNGPGPGKKQGFLVSQIYKTKEWIQGLSTYFNFVRQPPVFRKAGGFAPADGQHASSFEVYEIGSEK